jgi:hypothetical protein
MGGGGLKARRENAGKINRGMESAGCWKDLR